MLGVGAVGVVILVVVSIGLGLRVVAPPEESRLAQHQRREIECRIAARAAGHLDYIIRDKRETGCDVLIGGGEVVALEFGGE